MGRLFPTGQKYKRRVLQYVMCGTGILLHGGTLNLRLVRVYILQLSFFMGYILVPEHNLMVFNTKRNS